MHGAGDGYPGRPDGSAIQRLLDSYRLYTGTLLLRAGQWADSAQPAYEVEKLEFTSLINAQMHVLRLQLQTFEPGRLLIHID